MSQSSTTSQNKVSTCTSVNQREGAMALLHFTTMDPAA